MTSDSKPEFMNVNL